MKRTTTLLAALLVFWMAAPPAGWSHCQVPCGIFDDQARVSLLEEHVTTIEKAIKQIGELSQAGSPNYNQIVRWVTTKDAHADDMAEIITAYFMAQRIKPVDSDDAAEIMLYQQRLSTLHKLLVYSMKAKQSLDLENVEKMKKLLGEFHNLYFHEK